MAKRYPAIFALFAVISGILLADSFDISSWIFLFFGLALIIVLIGFYFKGNITAAGVVGLFCLAALSAYGYSFRMKTYPPGHIIHFVDDDYKYTVYGTIDDWPIISEHNTDVTIAVDSIGLGKEIKRGKGHLLIHIGTETTDLRYGDRIYFVSRLYSLKGGRNPTGFDYRRYLNLKGVFAVAYLPHQYNIQIDPLERGHFYRVVGKIRNYITGTFKRTLDGNAAALASGFLIGDTRDIPTSIYNRFRDSGTLHLLAVSGSNVALVLIVFVFLMRASPLKSWSRTILLLLIVFVFSNLAFNQPSVVRASIMASLVLVGKYLQRRIDLNNIIALTALIILLVKPTELFDVGFQLSFATAWGLILLVPYAAKSFRPIHDRMYYKILIMPLFVCAIAQLVSLPMSAFYFQRMPMISFLSNLIVVPLVSIIVIASMVLLLFALVLPILGNFFGSLLDPLINVTLFFIKLFGSDQFNVLLRHQVTGITVLLYYTFLLLVSFSFYSKRARRLTLLYLLIAANGLVISSLSSEKEDYRFTIFSVSSGIVSVNQAVQTQVIFSDLPLKDYLVSEKIIDPYLANRGIKNPDLIALTEEYQTLNDISFLYDKNGRSRMYLPVSAKNVFKDIYSIKDIAYDGTRINFYDNNQPPSDFSRSNIILSGGVLNYEFDSSTILFLSNSIESERIFGFMQETGKDLIVVRPLLSKSDFLTLIANTAVAIQAIICNRADTGIGPNMADQTIPDRDFPEIIRTAQSGAVEVVIKNGQAQVLKQ